MPERGPLEEVDWRDHPPIAGRVHRTAAAVEDLVLGLRRELKETSDLGEYGARAIHRELVARGDGVVPSVRTIGRVLERRGALDAARRVRRPPPPPVGTCPRWPRDEPNSTTSTLSKACFSWAGSASRSSMSFRCLAGGPAPGRSRW